MTCRRKLGPVKMKTINFIDMPLPTNFNKKEIIVQPFYLENYLYICPALILKLQIS